MKPENDIRLNRRTYDEIYNYMWFDTTHTPLQKWLHDRYGPFVWPMSNTWRLLPGSINFVHDEDAVEFKLVWAGQ